MNVCLIILAVVSANHQPLCYSDDWGVVINASTETCKDVVRCIADSTEPNWREDPFSHWHSLLDDAEDGEMSIATNRAYMNGWPDYQDPKEARKRAWITCMVITRDRATDRWFNYKRRYHKAHR